MAAHAAHGGGKDARGGWSARGSGSQRGHAEGEDEDNDEDNEEDDEDNNDANDDRGGKEDKSEGTAGAISEELLLLVDASNGFNNLSRYGILWTVCHWCPYA